MNTALAVEPSKQPSDIDMSAVDVFSHVSKGELKTHKGNHYSLVSYRPVAIEPGDIDRAEKLVSERRTCHVFNDHSILQALKIKQQLENKTAIAEDRKPEPVFDMMMVCTGTHDSAKNRYLFIARQV